MIFKEVVKISDNYLIPIILDLYDLEDYEIHPVKAHEGGRNLAYTCNKEEASAKVIRITYLTVRRREDLLGEVEYIRYLYEHGASVADVVNSKNGKLLEELTYNNHTFYICVFKRAKGKRLVDNNYRYRQGVPISEYYYNCGKTLGKIHQLSKEYTPVHYRYSFFDKYNDEFINRLIPDSLSLLKEKLSELLSTLEGLDKNQELFGMVHLDYSDGNYMIDYDTGQITVFDFDNSCFCWYMYDLANVWLNGVGWIQFERDIDKRKRFMDDYFEIVVAGYKTETDIDKAFLEKLPLFIKAVIMENIVDAFEVMRNNEEEIVCDEELSYLIKCIEDDIPYRGFFHEIYSVEEPFEYESRII